MTPIPLDDSETTLRLPSILDAASASWLRQQMSVHLDAAVLARFAGQTAASPVVPAIRLDGTRVERVDGEALDVVRWFHGAARRRQVPVRWEGVSERLRTAARDAGVRVGVPARSADAA